MAIYKMIDGEKIKLTSDEIKFIEDEQKVFAEEKKIETDLLATKAKNKLSAITKLEDLGLSNNEITSLIGE
tara:strand:- start:172 stop:384 length:213 start_codon:yes stop_codon:yes gene_type:complete